MALRFSDSHWVGCGFRRSRRRTLLAAEKTGTAWLYVAGSLGTLGATAIALDAQPGFKAQAEGYRRAAAGFATMRTAYYDLGHLGVSTVEEARAKLDEPTARKAALDQNSPMIEGWTQDKPNKQRQAKS